MTWVGLNLFRLHDLPVRKQNFFRYVFDSNIVNSWHWYRYHFELLAKGFEHPFVRSISDACLQVDRHIQGYSRKFVNRMASIHGKPHDEAHYQQLLQLLAELLIVSHLTKTMPGGKFIDEPTIGNSRKNPELSIEYQGVLLGIEVKSPSLRQHQRTRSTRGFQIPGRSPVKSAYINQAGGEHNVTFPRDNPIKDFLMSADEKFKPFHESLENFFSVLVIVWDDFIFEPVTSLTNPYSGLFTKNSFAASPAGERYLFKFVDAVVVVRHMHYFARAAGEQPLKDGKAHAMDYGLNGKYPFNVHIPNPEGKPWRSELASVFQTLDLKDPRIGAEGYPLDLVMWLS